MVERLLFVGTLLAALGCGVVGGAFFAFSTFVMTALARLTPSQGIAAMQSINVVVINPWFMTALFGPALLCVALGVWAIAHWSQPGSTHLLAGALLYVVGTIGVTIAWNVPRNDRLARVDPASADGAQAWAQYVFSWTIGNHVRTAAAIVAMALFILAPVRRAAAEGTPHL